MLRIIIILLAIIIVLTAVKNFLRKYRILSSSGNKPSQDSRNNKNSGRNKDDKAVDAKFEEIK